MPVRCEVERLEHLVCPQDPALSNLEKTAQPLRSIFLISENGRNKWKALSSRLARESRLSASHVRVFNTCSALFLRECWRRLCSVCFVCTRCVCVCVSALMRNPYLKLTDSHQSRSPDPPNWTTDCVWADSTNVYLVCAGPSRWKCPTPFLNAVQLLMSEHQLYLPPCCHPPACTNCPYLPQGRPSLLSPTQDPHSTFSMEEPEY